MSRTRPRLTLLCWSILVTLLALRPTFGQTPTGKEFQVVLPAFLPYTEAQKNIATYRVEVMCSRKTQVFLKWGTTNYFPQGVTVNAGDRITFQNMFPLPDISAFQQPSLQLNHSEVNSRVLLVSADQPITVQLTLDTANRMESYTVMPTTAYDTLYTVATFSGWSQYSERSGFTVVASQDGTAVRFTTTVPTWDGRLPFQEDTVILNKNQAFSMRSRYGGSRDSTDLTGTLIHSNKPIGVLPFSIAAAPSSPPPPGFPGTMSNPILWPGLGWYGKPLMEPQLSDNAAGSLFYTIPFRRHDTSLVRVVAIKNNTSIDTNGVTIPLALNRGKFSDILFTGPLKIETSEPVVAMQLAFSGGADLAEDTIYSNGFPPDPDTVDIPYGGTMMTQLFPVDKYSRAVQWITPDPAQRPTLQDRPPNAHTWEHYAIITAPVSTADTVMLDGKRVFFSYTHKDGNYVSAVYKMIPRQHVVEAEEPISVTAYGFEWDDSYGINAGVALRSRAKFGLDSINLISCNDQLDTVITVENLGNNTFLIDSLKAVGFDIKVLIPVEFPWQYQPGTKNNLAIVVKTPLPGTYSGYIRIYTDANNRKVWDIPVTIIRDSARLQLPATTIDFGVVSPSTPSVDTCIMVHNRGIRPLSIDALSLNGSGFSIVDPQTPVSINPGDSLCITLRFTPPADGLTERTLSIAGNPCLTTIDITVRGFKGGGPSLGVQRSIDYPNFLCSSPDFVDSTVVLRSIGDEPVQILTASFSGTFSGDYSFPNGSPQGQSIAPGGQLPITVRFTPGGFGPRNASLDLTTNAANAPTISIDLRARKDTAMIRPSNSLLDFGSIKSCDDSLELPLTFANDGTVPDTITSIDFAGVSAYSIDQQLPIIVHPGITKQISVRFAPQSDGNFAATLHAVGSPCGSEASVSLSGRRISPALNSNTVSLDFGTVYLCDGATSKPITLSNTGELADTILRASFNGSPAFVLQESYPIVIEPGASRSFTVSFTPNNPGAYDGQLTFEWGPCEQTTTLQVTGTALRPATQIATDAVDFGTVNINTSATGTIVLRNTGNAPRTVTAIDLGGASDVSIETPGTLPATIAPGDSLVIGLRYAPSFKGDLQANATISIAEPCAEQQSFTIKGTAVGDDIIIAELTVAVPDGLTGNVGRDVEIPVTISSSTNLAAAAISSMTIRMHHRYTMLLPNQVSTTISGATATISSSSIVGDDRLIELTISGGTFPATGTIATIRALGLLGDTSCSDIVVDAVEITTPPNRQVTVNKEDGGYCTEGYCQIDGDRLVRLGGGVRLKPSVPNPFVGQTTIEYALEQGQEVELVVTDMVGNQVTTLVKGNVGAGTHQVEFSGKGLAPGLYFCELRTVETTVREGILLVR